MATLDDFKRQIDTAYNAEAEAEKQKALQSKTEAERQIDLARKYLEESANRNVNNAQAQGAKTQEQQRIVTQFSGLGGTGAGIQRQEALGAFTQQNVGKILEAKQKSENDLNNQLTGINTTYQNNLLNIDSAIKTAKEKAILDEIKRIQREQSEPKQGSSLVSVSSIKNMLNNKYNPYDPISKIRIGVQDKDKAGLFNEINQLAVEYGLSQKDYNDVLLNFGLNDYNPGAEQQKKQQEDYETSKQKLISEIEYKGFKDAGNRKWFGVDWWAPERFELDRWQNSSKATDLANKLLASELKTQDIIDLFNKYQLSDDWSRYDQNLIEERKRREGQ